MNQPQFTEGPPVPLMVEGVLDDARLAQLAADLSTATTILAIREKGGAASYASPEELSLSEGLSRLQDGRSAALQIHYRFDGFEWIDTLLRMAAGYRLVRCRVDGAG